MTQPAGPVTRFRRVLGTRVAPARFVLFMAVLVGVSLFKLLPGVEHLTAETITGLDQTLARAETSGWKQAADAIVVGFDVAVLVFAASLLPLGKDRGAAVMRRHARENDANRMLVLVVTAIVSLAILFAMMVELPEARSGHALAKLELVGTLALGWLFTNLVFMLHYSHMFYSDDPATKKISGGFDFKGTKEPDFWDFLYFSFTAGMSFAASDVDVTSQAVRKVVVLQCLLSFVFNIGALAFCINVLAGSN